MPYINTKTTVTVTAEQEKNLKAKLGKAIETIPGKTESWLMLSFEDNARMWFRGENDAPCAMVEIKLFGKAPASAYDKMTAAVCEILSAELSVPQDRIYVKYEECENWGYDGGNF